MLLMKWMIRLSLYGNHEREKAAQKQRNQVTRRNRIALDHISLVSWVYLPSQPRNNDINMALKTYWDIYINSLYAQNNIWGRRWRMLGRLIPHRPNFLHLLLLHESQAVLFCKFIGICHERNRVRESGSQGEDISCANSHFLINPTCSLDQQKQAGKKTSASWDVAYCFISFYPKIGQYQHEKDKRWGVKIKIIIWLVSNHYSFHIWSLF